MRRLTAILTLFLLVLLFGLLSNCAINEGHEGQNVKADEKLNSSGGKIDLNSVYDRKSYQALLKTMRQQQTMAMKSMTSITDNQRLKTLVGGVVTKLKSVFVNSKNVVETAKFQPSNNAFPSQDPLREAVAKIVENTAFYFELTVYLPDMLDLFTHRDPEMKPLITWCFEFVQKMDIYDEETSQLIVNGAQELLIIPRPKDYQNPYRKVHMQKLKKQEAFDEYQKKLLNKKESKKMEAKLKPKKTGPKLTRSEL